MAPDLENIADRLPRRYREILDAADRVERRGARDTARRWRVLAIERYSRAWDTSALRWMENLLARIGAFEEEQERQVGRAA
jgi:transposase InsO family protein